MPDLSEIRAHGMATQQKELRLEVGRGANTSIQFAEEIATALKPVYDAAQKGDWGSVLLAWAEVKDARARLDHSLDLLLNDAQRALRHERLTRKKE